MLPTPVFETERIRLRPFTTEDTPDLRAYLSHPELSGRRYIPWKFDEDLPISPRQAEGIIDSWNEIEDGFCYAIVKQSDGILIGHINVDWGWDPHMPESTVVIDPSHQRQGYGTEALTLALNYLYDFTIAHNISTWVTEWNTPGQAFAEKMGFTNVGKLRRSSYRAGRFYDEFVFDLLRPEWKERRHAA
jgi:RimJ/RimL family protein N-acetyltransferase